MSTILHNQHNSANSLFVSIALFTSCERGSIGQICLAAPLVKGLCGERHRRYSGGAAKRAHAVYDAIIPPIACSTATVTPCRQFVIAELQSARFG